MNCLRCGADIGDQLGICAECREAPRPTPEEQSPSPLNETLPSKNFLVRSLRRFIAFVVDLASAHPVGTALLVVALTFSLLAYTDLGWRPAKAYVSSRPAGVVFPEEPLQTTVSGASWDVGEFNITPLADFQVRALLLFKIKYHGRSKEFDISPLDLVIGWGPMSDSKVLNQVTFAHGHRVVYPDFRDRENAPIDYDTIGTSFSHIHAIPASETINRKLENLEDDQGVFLRGKLVSVLSEGWNPWTSSLSRTDHGCEIFWIEEAAAIPVAR